MKAIWYTDHSGIGLVPGHVVSAFRGNLLELLGKFGVKPTVSRHESGDFYACGLVVEGVKCVLATNVLLNGAEFFVMGAEDEAVQITQHVIALAKSVDCPISKLS